VLLEEAAVALVGSATLHGVFLNCDASPRDHVFVYVAQSYSRVKTGPETAEVGFFPTAELPVDTAPSTRRRISEVRWGESQARTW
jgi:hypothetical protein